MEVVEVKKASRQNHSKTHSSGIPKNLALEKCVMPYTIKVQPSLYRILKQSTPSQIRKILLNNSELLEGEESAACGHNTSSKAQNPSRRGVAKSRALTCRPSKPSRNKKEMKNNG